jgi:hypothetical protein
LKKRPFWGNRALCGALVLGLVVLVGLGGYALHRVDRRHRLPATGAQASSTPAQGPRSPAPAPAGTATAAWETVLPAASGTPQATPSPGEVDWAAAEQPAPVTLQALPSPAAPAPSAALATLDSTLPPAAPSPTSSPVETPVETTPVSEQGNDAAVLEQDGRAVTADNVVEGGEERSQGGPGAGRAQDNPSGAFTPTTLRARVRWRHVDRPRPPARPSFWQWLFGQKETKKARPDKPRN